MKSFKNLGFDATVIEILSEDEIPEDKYLYPDMNYINGYEQYIKWMYLQQDILVLICIKEKSIFPPV